MKKFCLIPEHGDGDSTHRCSVGLARDEPGTRPADAHETALILALHPVLGINNPAIISAVARGKMENQKAAIQ